MKSPNCGLNPWLGSLNLLDVGKKPKTTSQETFPKVNARCARHAMEDGQYRKAMQALSSVGVAPSSPDVLDGMLSKHPQAPPLPISTTTTTPTPTNISEADVLRAVKSFPAGSASGPSSLRASHFKEALQCPSSNCAVHVTRALSNVVKLLSNGCAPPEVAAHLFGATLLACQKKDGALHPIAVGKVLRRLTSKCLFHSVQQQTVPTLTSLQVGVGVKGECEAIVHAVSLTLEDPYIPPGEQ